MGARIPKPVRVPEKSRGSQRSPGGAACPAGGTFFLPSPMDQLVRLPREIRETKRELAIARRALQDQQAARGRPRIR
jgi:hypothetical protein